MGLCNANDDKRGKKRNKGEELNTDNKDIMIGNSPEKKSSNFDKERIINRLSKNSKFYDINKDYTISQTFLGKGATGIVREATDKSGQKFAVKTVWKSDIEQNECFKREIDISLELKNEFIVQCFDIYEDNLSLHLVLELVSGGDLFDHIIHSEGKKLKENEAIDLLEQILKALQYLHEEVGVVHRDIKPENFLIYNENGRNKLKLIDFGFATYCRNGETMKEQLGTPLYAAPEIFKQTPYTNKVDLWSTGVVLYNMIKGTQPFSSKTENIKDQVLNKEIDFSCFKNPDLKGICESLLERDPEKRFTAFQALNSLKLLGQNQQNEATYAVEFRPDINKIIFILYNDKTITEELRNIFLSECTLNEVDKMFQEILATKLDKNKTNNSEINCDMVSDDKIYMKAEKLIEFGQNSKFAPNNLKMRLKRYSEQKVIEKIKKQMININKFFVTIIESLKFMRKLRCLNEFNKMDKSNLGWISPEQLKNYFIDPIKKNNIKTIVQPNQRIEFETFYQIANEYDGIKKKELSKKYGKKFIK